MSQADYEKIKHSLMKPVDCQIQGCTHFIEWRCGYPGKLRVGGTPPQCLCYEGKSPFANKGDKEVK